MEGTANTSPRPAGWAPCAWCASEQREIDALVTPELVFPDPEQRRLFDTAPPAMEGNARTYGFQLKTQPGMVSPRHFCLVSVTFAHAAPAADAPGSPTLSSTGGPNGSLIDAAALTADHVYRVQVSQAALLPASVQISPFDPMKTLTELLRRYESFKAAN